MTDETRAEQHRDKLPPDSVSASNPPANAGSTSGSRPDKPSSDRREDEIPTGLPTSDRHATETAHQWEDQVATPGKR